ncbi:hypothetical protein TNCV_4379371 [Trichonephila clavipes]|nr:hypothetical protein TNCV_4379371 [Trichonephila clavipes]
MVLKANDRRTSCPCHDEFRGPRSDYVRQVALATTTTTYYYYYHIISFGDQQASRAGLTYVRSFEDKKQQKYSYTLVLHPGFHPGHQD